MTIYNVIQCSVCRRIKDVERDNIRAMPNQCIITKGCSGFLFPIGETTILTSTQPVSGLTDWYPRGQKPSSTPNAPVEQTVSLSTSNSGVVTLAINVPESNTPGVDNPWGSSPPSNIVAAFTQQLTQTVPYNEFIYNVGTTTTIIFGRDSTGKNLRFSVADIVNGLIFVLVNGVASFPSPTATPTGWWTTVDNQLTFYNSISADSIVTVSVYALPPTATVFLDFTINQNLTIGVNSGSWSNIRWVEEYDPTTGNIKVNKWWVYSCSSVGVLGNSARLKFLGLYLNDTMSQPVLPMTSSLTDFSKIRFFLAAPPYDNTDRYLNFYIDGSIIGGNYALITNTTNITELLADISALTELYPPFQLVETINLSTSFISADTYPTNDLVSLTTPKTRLNGVKILGPV